MEVLYRYTFLSLFYIYIVLHHVHNSYHVTINTETVNLGLINKLKNDGVTWFAIVNIMEKNSAYFSRRPSANIFLYGPLPISQRFTSELSDAMRSNALTAYATRDLGFLSRSF